MASWWVPRMDGVRGRQPFTTLRKAALGGEIVQMDIEPALMPARFEGWLLVVRAYTGTADVTLALEQPEDGA
jgi:hypothetical protein